MEGWDHKRIALAASKVGLQPYLPPEGLCVLVERAELQPGVLPMACVAFFVGSFDFELASCLACVWGMYHCHYGFGSGIAKLARRAGSHDPYHRGRIDTGRPCFDGLKPRACLQATICSLQAVLGWSTSS